MENFQTLFSHTPNSAGQWHSLEEHLKRVAVQAQRFAGKFDGDTLGYWAGLWHDIGKAHPQFQDYLRKCAEEPGKKHSGIDHKGAGSIWAVDVCDSLSWIISGHHGGLKGKANLKAWLREMRKAPHVQEAHKVVKEYLSLKLRPDENLSLPVFLKTRLDMEFFLRMLFSSLVDADFLDTENHFSPDYSEKRCYKIKFNDLCETLERNQESLIRDSQGPLNQIRKEIYHACLEAASQAPGLFRLTVPTGGGKTRAGIAFALRHALQHGMERVIVAIPYTSIIEQTAAEYKKIFGKEVVLEHHSGVSREQEEKDDKLWTRLASENWDAPIIVTTTVQLFESIFGNRARGQVCCWLKFPFLPAGSVATLN